MEPTVKIITFPAVKQEPEVVLHRSHLHLPSGNLKIYSITVLHVQGGALHLDFIYCSWGPAKP